MKTRRKRLDKQTLLILGAVLGLESVACIGVAWSIHGRKTAQENTLQAREEALEGVRTASASLPALQEQYRRMQAQVASLEQALPSESYIPTLLGQIEQTAGRSGVMIREFRPKAVPAAAGGSGPGADQQAANDKLMFEMNVNGTYRQMQQFLANLTRFRKILALNGIKLQPDKANEVGVSPKLNGTLSFTAFLLPNGAAAAPSTAPGAPSGPGAGTPANEATRTAGPAEGGALSATAPEADPRG